MLSLLSSGMHWYDVFAISPCLSSGHSLHVCDFAISILSISEIGAIGLCTVPGVVRLRIISSRTERTERTE